MYSRVLTLDQNHPKGLLDDRLLVPESAFLTQYSYCGFCLPNMFPSSANAAYQEAMFLEHH